MSERGQRHARGEAWALSASVASVRSSVVAHRRFPFVFPVPCFAALSYSLLRDGIKYWVRDGEDDPANEAIAAGTIGAIQGMARQCMLDAHIQGDALQCIGGEHADPCEQ